MIDKNIGSVNSEQVEAMRVNQKVSQRIVQFEYFSINHYLLYCGRGHVATYAI